MKTIKLTEETSKQLIAAFENMLPMIKKDSQGMLDIHQYFDPLHAICPEILSGSANFYDCDGTRGFAIKLRGANGAMLRLRFDDGINEPRRIQGFAIAPRGYLEKYYKFRAIL